MAWWNALIGPAVSSIEKIIDELHTSDEEKMSARLALAKVELEYKARAEDLEHKFEQELTKRHAADMASTAWLPKNIRPLSLVFLLGIATILSFLDGNLGSFFVNPSYINMYESLLLLSFGFYFGSRGLEKVAGIVTTMKSKK